MASILLSGSIGSGGAFSVLGFANVQITGNADVTLNLSQYSNLFLKVTSDGTSTGVRQVIAPLFEGETFIVRNATSEGFAILLIGPSGTGVSIPSGACALVTTDGTNYYSLSGVQGVVANIAALSALPTGGFVQGQLVTVATVGALWAYQPAGTLTTDGITIVAAAGGGQWWRSLSIITESAIAQGTWVIDPQTGNDEANGLTNGTALKSFAEYVRRCGTRAPVLKQNTTFTWISSQTAAGDPIVWEPILSGGFAAIVGTLTQASAGVLASVTAKNRATPQLLLANSGATTTKQLVINTTHPSRAWTYVVSAGAIFKMSQPLVGATVPTAFGSVPAEVDTWANGDAVTVSTLPAIELVKFAPVIAEIDGSFVNWGYLQHVRATNPVFGLVTLTGNVICQECDLSAVNVIVAPGGIANNFWNSNLFTNLASSDSVFPPVMNAGAVYGGGTGLTGWFGGVDGDLIFANNNSSFSACLGTGSQQIGFLYLDTGAAFDVAPGGTLLAGPNYNYGGSRVWGPGLLNAIGTARLRYSGVAANIFTMAALAVNGLTTAQAYATAAGTGVWSGPRALSGAQLDTTVAGGGFGGQALGVGGATITNALI